MKKGQVINGTMIWIASLALAGVTAFFNLKSNVAVVERTEELHYKELKEQLMDVNKKLDKIADKLGVGTLKEETKK